MSLSNSHRSFLSHYSGAGRAFSLVEAAIVLGVVGVVIGGIWLAASAVQFNNRVRQAKQAVFTIAANTQNFLSARDAVGLGDPYDFTVLAIPAGVFPADWVSGSTVIGPFGKAVGLANYGTTLSAARFDIRYYDVPKDACIALIMQVSAIGAMSGGASGGASSTVRWMEVGNDDFANYTWHLSPVNAAVSISAAATACAYTANDMAFTFSYRPY